MINLSDYNVVIEIDEHQHKRAGYLDEQIRVNEIFEALGKKPLTVIRFNPDRFNKLNNRLFSKTSTGSLEIMDQSRYDQAISELVAAVHQAINNPPIESKDESDSIKVVKLRFDTV